MGLRAGAGDLGHLCELLLTSTSAAGARAAIMPFGLYRVGAVMRFEPRFESGNGGCGAP
jgi:hypothetical protein